MAEDDSTPDPVGKDSNPKMDDTEAENNAPELKGLAREGETPTTENDTEHEDKNTVPEREGAVPEREGAVPEREGALDKMFGNYFLEYASYVILERAVPALEDGLKPVQRRILHALERMDDGRYTKVANIVGDTMKYHPHGDQSIGDAIVGLGQKNLLIDTQGNWGHPVTGDPAAAPRYIEGRLTPFAKAILYSPKVTHWAKSYDGRNDEPVTFPSKFPLLLAQGVEGIAVGLSTTILPHNFLELIDACIAALRKEPFALVPDFPGGGLIDASNYNDGLRGGRIRVRARIEIERKLLLKITAIPFGTTVSAIMESIAAANEKEKIKIAKIDDNTTSQVEILVHLISGSEPEDMIKALFAFTDCEKSLSANSCVIFDNHPRFLGVTEIVEAQAESTREIIGRELEIELHEQEEKWHFASLERIFIENRIYRDIEDQETWEGVLKAIAEGLKPHIGHLKRTVTRDDILRLTEIRIKRISKFDLSKAQADIEALEGEIERIKKALKQLTRTTIKWFEWLKSEFGQGRERRSQIVEGGFDSISAREVALANETLYVDWDNGFAGTALKKEGEALAACSDLDDILVICEDGTLVISRVQPKAFIGNHPQHVEIWSKETFPIYSMIYRDGKGGPLYAKRFQVTAATRDREYPLTQGKPGSVVLWFACHASEAESNEQQLVVRLRKVEGLRKLELPFDFSQIGIKNRKAKGNLVTKKTVQRIRSATKREQDDLFGDEM